MARQVMKSAMMATKTMATVVRRPACERNVVTESSMRVKPATTATGETTTPVSQTVRRLDVAMGISVLTSSLVPRVMKHAMMATTTKGMLALSAAFERLVVMGTTGLIQLLEKLALKPATTVMNSTVMYAPTPVGWLGAATGMSGLITRLAMMAMVTTRTLV